MNFFSNKTMKMEIKKTAKEKAFVEVDNAFSLEEFLEDMYNRHNLGGIKEVRVTLNRPGDRIGEARGEQTKRGGSVGVIGL